MIENQTAQCPICLEDMEEQLMYFGCHTFHRECVKNYTKAQLEAGTFPIKCPEDQCTLSLDFESIRDLRTPELQEFFLDLSIKNYISQNNKNLIHCPTPNCSFTVEYELACQRPQGVNKVYGRKCNVCDRYVCRCVREIICSLCNKSICVLCKESHPGLNCYQNHFNKNLDKNFNAFVKFIRDAKFKKCPDCQFWVEKSMGCDHMTCRCGKQFCYKCNGEYLKCYCLKQGEKIEIYPREVRQFKPITPPKPKIPKAILNKAVLKPTQFQFLMPTRLNLSVI